MVCTAGKTGITRSTFFCKYLEPLYKNSLLLQRISFFSIISQFNIIVLITDSLCIHQKYKHLTKRLGYEIQITRMCKRLNKFSCRYYVDMILHVEHAWLHDLALLWKITLCIYVCILRAGVLNSSSITWDTPALRVSVSDSRSYNITSTLKSL